ncbi:MAG: 3-oxoacyl-[acyl-carrier-protein] synthase III C-terminal domain-containing protein [Cardiobacteriaceae bacterium]|nr:3-oxoacyl-[acyl-carrier-protein] synthase III C-terminal domain-containing protein [Cardiobacteriaceae bacterium]
MSHRIDAGFLGIGMASGHRRDNAALESQWQLPPGEILRQSGVRSRQVLPPEMSQARFAADAVEDALAAGGLAAADIDLLIATAAVPQQAIPCTAAFIAAELGLAPGTPAFDVNASCLGFVVALHNALHLLDRYGTIAVVAADIASRGVDWRDVHTASIFGDGAAAVILSREGGARFRCLAYDYGVHPEGRALCEIRGGGTARHARAGMSEADFYFRMDGHAVFKMAIAHLPPFTARLLARAGWDFADVDHVIAHQASHLGMQHAQRHLPFRAGSVIDIYAEHGNQVSASIPVVLAHAARAGHLAPGARLLLLGTAAGFAIGGMALEML